MNNLVKHIKKNASRQINTLLDAATSINFVYGENFANHDKTPSTADDVRDYIAKHYDSVKILLTYKKNTGRRVCAEIHHNSMRYNHFVLRFELPERLEAAHQRAAAHGLSIKGAAELSLWQGGKCLGGNEDLEVIETMLSTYERSLTPVQVTPEQHQALEFISARLENDVLSIFKSLSDDIKTDTQLIIQFNPLIARMLRLGIKQKEAGTLVKAAVNRVGARFDLPPLFKDLSI